MEDKRKGKRNSSYYPRKRDFSHHRKNHKTNKNIKEKGQIATKIVLKLNNKNEPRSPTITSKPERMQEVWHLFSTNYEATDCDCPQPDHFSTKTCWTTKASFTFSSIYCVLTDHGSQTIK
jgi:hypothetical protein